MHMRVLLGSLNGLNNYQKYRVDKMKYKNKKDSWIKLTKIYKIPIKNLGTILCKLKKKDMKQIQKRLNIQKELNKKIKLDFNLDTYPTIGDIVEIENKQYYIFKTKEKHIYCYRVFNNIESNENNYKEIIVGKEKYYINGVENKQFLNSKDYKIINTSTKSEIRNINNIIKNIKLDFKKYVKKNKRQNREKLCKLGNVLKVGRTKVLFLYCKKDVPYGIDINHYKNAKKLYAIQSINDRKILRKVSKDKCLKIVECLYNNNVKQIEEVEKLYNELKSMENKKL